MQKKLIMDFATFEGSLNCINVVLSGGLTYRFNLPNTMFRPVKGLPIL